MKLVLSVVLLIIATSALAQDRLKVALDWTPNTNHVGLYVAQAQGWFDAAGFDVTILPYEQTSPEQRVSGGEAQFGIFSATKFYIQRAKGTRLTAVLAVVQHETARVVFNADDDEIHRPADLDWRTYGGFGSTWENALLSEIIRSDGGEGVFDSVTLGTSAYQALADGEVDFTLEVITWEGVEADLLGLEQQAFRYADYGVPDQHSTFLGANSAWLQANPERARAFVQVVQRGYGFAHDNPEAAARMLIAQTGDALTDSKLALASMRALVEGGFLRDPNEPVGLINDAMTRAFVAFMAKVGALRDSNGRVLQQAPDISGWISNEYLQC